MFINTDLFDIKKIEVRGNKSYTGGQIILFGLVGSGPADDQRDADRRRGDFLFFRLFIPSWIFKEGGFNPRFYGHFSAAGGDFYRGCV